MGKNRNVAQNAIRYLTYLFIYLNVNPKFSVWCLLAAASAAAALPLPSAVASSAGCSPDDPERKKERNKGRFTGREEMEVA
jgi:hypothetical protein